MFPTVARRLITTSSYVNILHQHVLASGCWPQELELAPDLTFGGMNVTFMGGKVIGIVPVVYSAAACVDISHRQCQYSRNTHTGPHTPQGQFTSSGVLCFVNPAALRDVCSFQMQCHSSFNIQFWNADQIVAFVRFFGASW